MQHLMKLIPSCFIVNQDSPLADVITYRVAKDMVYVPLAQTYLEALQLALKVFPQLSGIDSDQICLTLLVTLRGQSSPVRISPMSWNEMRKQLVQYEILDVTVANKVLWSNIEELEETSPSARGPPPTYSASLIPRQADTSIKRSPFQMIARFFRLLQKKNSL